VLVLYGITTVGHGSGFLAVFVAALSWATSAPLQTEIERFHSALASLGEIVAFVVLGLTVHLVDLTKPDVWVPGLVLGLSLAVIIQAGIGGSVPDPRQAEAQRAGLRALRRLKGAVPILLGSLLLAANVPGAQRLYGIIIVVVVFSVLVQGSLVPTVVRALHLPMRIVAPQPWSFGVRLAEEPEGVLRLTVGAGSRADGATVEHVADAVTDPLTDSEDAAMSGSTCWSAAGPWSQSGETPG